MIKRKVIKEVYTKHNKHSDRYNERFLEVRQELINQMLKGNRQIYLDQVNFSNRSDQRVEFSNKYHNISFVKSETMIQPLYVNVAISEEFGIEAFRIHNDPITSKSFIKIFDEIDRNGTDYHCLADGASWHSSKFTT